MKKAARGVPLAAMMCLDMVLYDCPAYALLF